MSSMTLLHGPTSSVHVAKNMDLPLMNTVGLCSSVSTTSSAADPLLRRDQPSAVDILSLSAAQDAEAGIGSTRNLYACVKCAKLCGGTERSAEEHLAAAGDGRTHRHSACNCRATSSSLLVLS